MRRFGGLVVVLTCLAMATGMMAGCGGKSTPRITSITPDTGPPMTQIIISGSGFGKGGGMTKVEFNGNAIGIRTWTDTEIIATVPIGTRAGKYTVTVVTESATSEGVGFVVTGAASSSVSAPTKDTADPPPALATVLVLL